MKNCATTKRAKVERQQAGQKSTIYLMLFVFAAMIISALSIDSKADENDWFVYLGTQEAKKSPRKNINAAEALPPLPLPATPLRRTERKKPPQPDYLVGKVIWGESASFADSTGKKMEIADWNLCPTDTEKFVVQKAQQVNVAEQMNQGDQQVNIAKNEQLPK